MIPRRLFLVALATVAIVLAALLGGAVGSPKTNARRGCSRPGATETGEVTAVKKVPGKGNPGKAPRRWVRTSPRLLVASAVLSAFGSTPVKDLSRLLSREEWEGWLPGPDQQRRVTLAEIRRACEVAEAAGDESFLEELGKKARKYLRSRGLELADDHAEAARRLVAFVQPITEVPNVRPDGLAVMVLLGLLLSPDGYNAEILAVREAIWRNADQALGRVTLALERLVSSKDGRHFTDDTRRRLDAEAVIKCALKALGYPAKKADNYFALRGT